MSGVSSARLTSGPRVMAKVLGGGSMVAAWCALWGEVSVANLLSGVAVVAAAMSIGMGPSGRSGLRVVPFVRLVAVVGADLVWSTIAVARDTLDPRPRPDEAIVAVQVPTSARHHLLLLVVAITVTPGTAVVDSDPDRCVLYLHVLDKAHRDRVIRQVANLAELACVALPVDDEAGAGMAR